jgi:hypothetical protein
VKRKPINPTESNASAQTAAEVQPQAGAGPAKKRYLHDHGWGYHLHLPDREILYTGIHNGRSAYASLEVALYILGYYEKNA